MLNKCEECGKEGELVKIKELNEAGEIKIRNICKECAQKRGIIMESKTIMDRIKEFMEQITESDEDLVCRNCGLTFAEFKITRHFGCEFCYTYFDQKIKEMFSLIGEEFKYKGKDYSEKGDFSIWRKKVINYISQKLDKLVEEENYEAAARLRDVLKRIEEENGRTSQN